MREPSSIANMNATARHVVVARVPARGEDLLVPLRDLQNLFIRLLRKQPPAGDYSVLIMRQDGLPEVHCAFTESADAARLSEVLHGTPTAAKASESSRHFVELDEATLSRIGVMAGPPAFKRAKADLSDAAPPVRSLAVARRR